MKRLTLMRHGNAQWKDPLVCDFDRPLNRRGHSEAEAMSRRLIELKLIPTVVLTSSARRAVTTTAAPSRANSRAAASPIPLDAPVIMATLPSRTRGRSHDGWVLLITGGSPG